MYGDEKAAAARARETFLAIRGRGKRMIVMVRERMDRKRGESERVRELGRRVTDGHQLLGGSVEKGIFSLMTSKWRGVAKNGDESTLRFAFSQFCIF